MTFSNEIQQTKEDIAVLQEKLKKLEELARVKTPAEEAFYRIYSRYPDKLDDRHGSLWNGFITGYDLGYVHATKYAVENNKNFEPTPQTPEQVEQGLRDAMKKAKEDGVFDEPTKPMNEVLDRLENKYKRVEEPPKTLTDLIYRWWSDVFTTHSDWDMETSIEDLVDQIQLWLPKEQSAAGSQNAYVESAVEGFNDCLNKIKRKLR